MFEEQHLPLVQDNQHPSPQLLPPLHEPDFIPLLLPPPPANDMPEPPADRSFNSGAERVMHKNRLQELTQKSSLLLPVYTTINEGAQHSPRFKATVLVDGIYYTSEGNFHTRKSAEQEAARIALQNIHEKMKNDGCPIIREDMTFCKSILNEYAVKMRLKQPLYSTIQSGGLLPVFVSSLVFNGVSYTGDKGRNKKEAEQLAARAVILSILDTTDSASAAVIFEIIKSKSRLYAAIKDANSIDRAVNPTINTLEDPSNLLSKRKDAEVGTAIASFLSLDENARTQAADVPFHLFKKPKPETNTVVTSPPIVFVPPVLGQPLISSSSKAKRNRKNKRKAKGGTPIDPQMSVAAIVPLNQIPPCSVAQ